MEKKPADSTEVAKKLAAMVELGRLLMQKNKDSAAKARMQRLALSR